MIIFKISYGSARSLEDGLSPIITGRPNAEKVVIQVGRREAPKVFQKEKVKQVWRHQRRMLDAIPLLNGFR